MSKAPRTTPVEPIDGLAPWVGGKRYLAKTIIPMIDAVPHVCYAEPFVGMGGVFFRRTSRPRTEVINDLGDDVFNLFRIVKHHAPALLDEIEFTLASRRLFELILRLDPSTLTDVQRAARFFVWQSLCYSGRPGNRSFPICSVQGRGRRKEAVHRRLAAAHSRLAKVTIEHLPWQDFIASYDRSTTLFYLDPPYWGRETLYGKGLFSRADFEQMADLLARLKGRFILSLNDLPEVRHIFARFELQQVSVSYSAAPGAHVRAGELLITGP